MVDVKIEGLSRKDARDIIVALPRNKEFVVHVLKDGRRVFIRTDGKKESIENGKRITGIDITVHHDGETRGLNYIDDMLLDLAKKQVILSDEEMSILIEAIKDSIELVPIEEIYNKHSLLKELEKRDLPGHSIEFLLKVLRVLALQEDINYWGSKPSGKERYEGREKPIHALEDMFINDMSLRAVMRKHKL